MAWPWGRLLKISGWSYLCLLCGAVLLAAAGLSEDERTYFRPELLADKIIVVDPGHGGVDGGAVSAVGDLEKELTLQIAKKLAEKIRATGAKVVLTREDDRDYYSRGKDGKRHDLERRLAIAKENAGQIFISIHANAIKGKRWTGAQVFYYPGSAGGKALAATIQQHLKDFPPGNRRKEKAEDLYILRQSEMPAVIVETGFLSNAEEAARLRDESYQDRLAEEIFRGLVHYVAVKGSERFDK